MNQKLLIKLFSSFLMILFMSCSSDEEAQKDGNSIIIVKEYTYSPIELETMTIINDYRKSIGLNALEIINHVSYKSEEHDHYMIANNVVNHDAFVERSDNIIQALGALKVSENVAYNYNSAQGVFDAWMNSPSHKQNIIGNFTHFGLAIKENPVNGRKYYTNIFVKM
jgi:uncharacterized protein YkwD